MIDEALRTAVEDGSGEALLALARAVTADEELRGAQADHLSSWAQALSDLGYLDPADAPDADAGPLPPVVRAAVQRFLAELPDEDGDPGQAGAPAGVPPVLEGGVPDDELLREPGEVELARLLRFVSFDGELRGAAGELPEPGGVNAHSRALHYRLGVLGFYLEPPDTPFGPRTELALRQFAVALGYEYEGGLAPRDELFDLLADATALGRRASQALGPYPLILQDLEATRSDDRPLLIVQGLGRTHVVRDRRDLDRVPALPPKERERLEAEFRRWSSTRTVFSGLRNQLALRVLQLLLWIDGFYEGAVDGIWTRESWRALRRLLELEGIDADELVMPLDRGFAGLDAHRLLALHFPRIREERAHVEAQEAFLVQEIDTLAEATETAAARERKPSLFRRAFRFFGRIGRRVYQGARSLVGSAVRLLRKGLRWVGGRLAELVGPVRHLVRTLARGAVQGMSDFLRGAGYVVRFVLRRPFLTLDDAEPAAFVASGFDLDADATLGIVGPVSDETLVRHTTTVRRAVAWAGLLLPLTLRGLKTLAGLALGPAGWLKFVLRLGSIVRQSIEDWREFQGVAVKVAA